MMPFVNVGSSPFLKLQGDDFSLLSSGENTFVLMGYKIELMQNLNFNSERIPPTCCGELPFYSSDKSLVVVFSRKFRCKCSRGVLFRFT